MGEEWWFDPRNVCSKQFLGALIDDVTYGDAYERQITSTIASGRVGKRKLLVRDITVTGFIVASSEGGTEYGLDALNAIISEKACFGGGCDHSTLTIQAFTAQCDPAIDACVQTKVTEIEDTLNGNSIDSIVCRDAAGNLFPIYGTDEEAIQKLAESSCCAACDATRIFKRVLPRGPVQEINSSLKRSNGTRFSITFAAEVPHKFMPSYTIAAARTVGDISYPNWCCGVVQEEDPCLLAPTGELATGIIATQNGGKSCFCSPVFVNGASVQGYGHRIFETFINWEINNTGFNAIDNVMVEVWPDVEGYSPLTRPDLYAPYQPLATSVTTVPAHGTITYDGGSDTFTASGNGLELVPEFYTRTHDVLSVPCDKFWVVLKVDSQTIHYGDLRFTVSAQQGIL